MAHDEEAEDRHIEFLQKLAFRASWFLVVILFIGLVILAVFYSLCSTAGCPVAA